MTDGQTLPGFYRAPGRSPATRVVPLGDQVEPNATVVATAIVEPPVEVPGCIMGNCQYCGMSLKERVRKPHEDGCSKNPNPVNRQV